jgi:hypothetical protein
MEEDEWLNVKTVEPKSTKKEKAGRWLAAQIRQENGPN